ncbi:4228_t:CDS:2, partial [Dentiscutata heterogama]
TRHIPELELTAIQLRHEATGAEHLHIARDDDNNVFGVGFSTPPMNSSGTPHILEHTTLCGSKKFPIRDPFFKMLNRSLANFMNAFTANDYTIYPFSTTHLLDYENLRDVYMDATFHPYLRELDFKQEG